MLYRRLSLSCSLSAMGGCWRVSGLLLNYLHEYRAPAEAGHVCSVVIAVCFTVWLWLGCLILVLRSVELGRLWFATRVNHDADDACVISLQIGGQELGRVF